MCHGPLVPSWGPFFPFLPVVSVLSGPHSHRTQMSFLGPREGRACGQILHPGLPFSAPRRKNPLLVFAFRLNIPLDPCCSPIMPSTVQSQPVINHYFETWQGHNPLQGKKCCGGQTGAEIGTKTAITVKERCCPLDAGSKNPILHGGLCLNTQRI